MACADHNTLLALKTELDGLVVDIEAGAGVDASKAILRDVEVRTAGLIRIRVPKWWLPPVLPIAPGEMQRTRVSRPSSKPCSGA